MVLALCALLLVPMSGSDAADTRMVLTDGCGNTVILQAPAENVITIGVGVTATVIDIGCLDKIVVCDSYSRTNSDPVFDGLRERVDQGKVAAGGNIYSSGKDQLKTDIIGVSDPEGGVFDRERDVVIAQVSQSYRSSLDFLRDLGFKNVLLWDEVDDYSDVVSFVETISMACKGSVDPIADTMRAAASYIDNTIEERGMERAEAFYVTYSAGAFKVGNAGSLASVMIEAAGGDVITIDVTRTATTYETNLTSLVESHPGVTVFADTSIANSTENMKGLRMMIGDDAFVVPLKQIWNNFSTKSAEGVWTMACAMYPDVFHGDIPIADETADDALMYLGAAVVACVLVCIVFRYSTRDC